MYYLGIKRGKMIKKLIALFLIIPLFSIASIKEAKLSSYFDTFFYEDDIKEWKLIDSKTYTDGLTLHHYTSHQANKKNWTRMVTFQKGHVCKKSLRGCVNTILNKLKAHGASYTEPLFAKIAGYNDIGIGVFYVSIEKSKICNFKCTEYWVNVVVYSKPIMDIIQYVKRTKTTRPGLHYINQGQIKEWDDFFSNLNVCEFLGAKSRCYSISNLKFTY
jgi:hypothetical protein